MVAVASKSVMTEKKVPEKKRNRKKSDDNDGYVVFIKNLSRNTVVICGKEIGSGSKVRLLNDEFKLVKDNDYISDLVSNKDIEVSYNG